MAHNVGYVASHICRLLNLALEQKSVANHIVQGCVRIWDAFLSARLVTSAAGSVLVMALITIFREEPGKGLPH